MRTEASSAVLRIEPRRSWHSLDLRELWDFRELLYFLAWRDVKVRYKQTALGVIARPCGRGRRAEPSGAGAMKSTAERGSQPLTPEVISEQDALVIVADHLVVDYELFPQNGPLVVDTRGVCRRPVHNVVKA